MSIGLPVNSVAVRAARTWEMLRERGVIHDDFNLTVGQLCSATGIERVIELYNAWQRGTATEDEYTDAVLSALARVRVETGI